MESAVETICGRRESEGLIEYFVKWRNCTEENNSWEFASNLDCNDLINAFEAAYCKTATVAQSNKKGASATKKKLNSASRNQEARDGGGGDGLSSVKSSMKSDAFENGNEAEHIFGAIELEGLRFFLIKFKGIDEAKWVSSTEANIRIPQLVIKYYADRFHWDTFFHN